MQCFALTTMEKLQQVPSSFWSNCLLIIMGGVMALILVRHAKQMNKMVLGTMIFLFFTTVCFTWVYERNEPKALTPLVNAIAPFLPSKLTY